MKRKASTLFIILGILGAFVLAGVANKIMKATAPQPKEVKVVAAVPTVRVHQVQKTTIKLEVITQGVVEPSTETTLVTEVTGKIMKLSPAMEAGSFFKKGDLLLQVDDRDYQSALASAIAEISRAEADMATEKAEAEQARRDWERMGNGEKPSDLLLRLPQLARGEANLTSAQAAVNKARNDLERTTIKAPYNGRSREKMAEIGQFAGIGTQLGKIFATDYAEVRLPLSDEQLGKLDPKILAYRNEVWTDGPKVRLTGKVANKMHAWEGKIIRLEGVVDEKSRFYYAVARVDDPYGTTKSLQAPLAVGMFVNATIEGREIKNVAKIPRNALHPGNKVYVVTNENNQARLHIRTVEVITADADTVIIGSGLISGDQVATTPLATPIEGMALSIVDTKQTQNNADANINGSEDSEIVTTEPEL